VVHRRAIPPRAEIETIRATPAVRGFRAGCGGCVAVGVSHLTVDC